MSGRRVLVFGGTRYFGRRLVEKLLGGGDRVTIVTRASNPFGGRVAHLVAERGDESSLGRALGSASWDVVYDQVCYSGADARVTARLLKGRVGRYIFTSTSSVYRDEEGVSAESRFDPRLLCPITGKDRGEIGYDMAKREAEAVFFQEAAFPVAAMRVPIVLGPDDYTGRLAACVDAVRGEATLTLASLDVETSFISSAEAAELLLWLGSHSHVGPVNGASDGGVLARRLIGEIEAVVGRKARVRIAPPEAKDIPLFSEVTTLLDTRLARGLGFEFREVWSWLTPLIAELALRPLKS